LHTRTSEVNRRDSCLMTCLSVCSRFFRPATATTEIYTLSLHDALPISSTRSRRLASVMRLSMKRGVRRSGMSTASLNEWICSERSEEHTSELQSRFDLVCRLLLEKKKNRTLFAPQLS